MEETISKQTKREPHETQIIIDNDFGNLHPRRTSLLGNGCRGKWPSRPITIYIGFAPDGGMDMLGRLLSEEMKKPWASPCRSSTWWLLTRPGAPAALAAAKLFAVILMVRSWKKGGRIHATRIFGSTLFILKSQVHRPVLMGILLPAVYVFLGIPLIGFYLSSALFMTIMFYLFVKKWRKWFLFPPIALGITGILYLTFTRLFQLQIW